MNYEVVKKICLTLIVIVFISGYLSLAFNQFVTYVPPNTYRIKEPLINEIHKLQDRNSKLLSQLDSYKRTTKGDNFWDSNYIVPKYVIHDLQDRLIDKNNKIRALSLELLQTNESLKVQKALEAKDYAANTPFEQRLPEQDMGLEYYIYNVSMMVDPEATMDSTSYIIGPNDALKEKYINIRDTDVYIGNSQGTSQKIGACIRHWKKTSVFNVVLVNKISRQFNTQ